MTASVFIPGMLNLAIEPRFEDRRWLRVSLNFLAMIGQLSAILIWPFLLALTNAYVHWPKNENAGNLVWQIPLSLFLISCGWWENYVDRYTRLGGLGKFLQKMKRRITRTRTKSYLIISIWKIGIVLAVMLAMNWKESDFLFNFWKHESECIRKKHIFIETIPLLDDDPGWVLLIQAMAGFVCYFCVRAVCKIRVQQVCLGVPLVLVTPLLVGLTVLLCELRSNTPATFYPPPQHLFWACYSKGQFVSELLQDKMIWLGIIWWLSQLYIARHIWFPRCERLAKTEK